jgi:hypothetical protein
VVRWVREKETYYSGVLLNLTDVDHVILLRPNPNRHRHGPGQGQGVAEEEEEEEGQDAPAGHLNINGELLSVCMQHRVIVCHVWR